LVICHILHEEFLINHDDFNAIAHKTKDSLFIKYNVRQSLGIKKYCEYVYNADKRMMHALES